MIASIVDTTTLGKVIAYSLAAGVGIAVVYALGISSVAAVLEAIRERRTAAGIAWGVLAAACVGVALGAVALGVVVMTSKS